MTLATPTPTDPTAGDDQMAADDWDRCKPSSKSDVDGEGSNNGSGCGTRVPATTSEDDDNCGSGNGSGSSCEQAIATKSVEDDASIGSKPDTQEQDDNNPLPSLRKDGAEANTGSEGHPDNCKPCAFYCFSLRGCRNGNDCSFCHLFHESKLRQRREEWKKTQREKRGGARRKAAAAEQAEGSTVDLETSIDDTDPGSADYASTTQAPGTSATDGTYDGTIDDSELSTITGISCSPTGATLVAYDIPSIQFQLDDGRPVARVAYELPEPQRVALPQALGFIAGNMQQQPAAPSPLSSPLGRQKGPIQVQQQQQHQQPPQRSAPRPQMQNPSGYNLQAAGQNLPNAQQNISTNVFAYTPSSAVIGVGQAVELWPPLEIITQDMVFAVSPELPAGLTLDERVGVIHGRPLVQTNTMVSHFITACKAGDLSASMQISKVTIKIVEINPAEFSKKAIVSARTMLNASRSLNQKRSIPIKHKIPHAKDLARAGAGLPCNDLPWAADMSYQLGCNQLGFSV